MSAVPGTSSMLATHVAGVLDRPADTPLGVALVFVVLAAGLHAGAWHLTRPARPTPGPPERPPSAPHGPESAAVVGLLTNGFDVPRSAAAATVIDLAARGWLRLAHSDGELIVVTKSDAADGDSLRLHEQLVLNHLVSRSYHDVVSGVSLAAAQRRLGPVWWRRFGRAVASAASDQGLTTARYGPVHVGPVMACLLVTLEAARRAMAGGTEIAVAESWWSRTLWFVVVAGAGWLGWSTYSRWRGAAQRPTPLGAERADLWLGYRARLAERIPPHASVVGAPNQQDALARAYVMGLCRQVGTELPIAAEDPRRAWSDAGGSAHVVRVHYPVLPGYGQHPLKVLTGGIVALLLAVWLRSWLDGVADGTRLDSLLDDAPGQRDVFEGIARTLAVLCWVPILAAGWAVLAGTVDTVIGRSRTGRVVRARQPHEALPRAAVSIVRPFGERSGFATYLAVDDGRRDDVVAWLAGERAAAPQGTQARVIATPLLGYVRTAEPIGSTGGV